MASVTITVSGEGIGSTSTTATFTEQEGIEILYAHSTRYPTEFNEDGTAVPKSAQWIVDRMCKTVIGDVIGFTCQYQKTKQAELAAAAVKPIEVTLTN